MPSLIDELSEGLNAAIALYGQSFAWGGRTGIPCVRRDQPTAAELLEEGGFIEGVDYFLTVAKAAFPDGVYPRDGDLVNGGTGQIKQVNGAQDVGAPQLVLQIGSPER